MGSWLIKPFSGTSARAIKWIALFVIVLSYGCSSPPLVESEVEPNEPPAGTSTLTPEIANNPSATLKATHITASPSPSKSSSLSIPELQPTTETPLNTATAGGQFTPKIGGAEQIAFIEEDDIWIANLDGGKLIRLTNDGGLKSSLNWAADGSKLYFISGQCLEVVEPESLPAQEILCFEEGHRPYSFQISPDGNQAAISLNQELYIVPFKLESLMGVRNGKDLADLGSCASLSPYKHRQSMVSVLRTHWSADGQQLAILRLGFDDDQAVEIIHIVDVSRCTSPLPRLDEFPATRIQMENYKQKPILQDFSWDGKYLFAFSDFKRNDGFGDLWIYNQQLHEGFKANPIGGKCCYRDAAFSPDGSYLAFAYQDASQVGDREALLYYIPFAALESSLVYPPIPFPEEFFLEPRTRPQPVLRPVQNRD